LEGISLCYNTHSEKSPSLFNIENDPLPSRRLKQASPSRVSGYVSRRCVSSAARKQATKFFLCRSTPMCLTALVPPLGEKEADAKRRLLGVAPRSYPGSVIPLRGAGGGSRIGHTVSRALTPTTASGPRSVSRSPPPCAASMLHPTPCLYHDLLGTALHQSARETGRRARAGTSPPTAKDSPCGGSFTSKSQFQLLFRPGREGSVSNQARPPRGLIARKP
jgi:hypothetical protein